MKERRGYISHFLVSSTAIVAVFLSVSLCIANVPNLTRQGNSAGPERSDLPMLQALSVDVDCDPDTLNLESKGKWITCYIDLAQINDTIFTVEQVNWSEIVQPVGTPEDGASFYDYHSASSHTGYEEPFKSKFMLHKNLVNEDVSLIIHHNIDRDSSGIITGLGRVDFDLEGIPPGAFVSQSDDPFHLWDPPRGLEFSLAYPSMEGHWYYGDNTDGGALDGLPTDDEWSITINPLFWNNIDSWEFVSGDGAVYELDMSLPVTVSKTMISHSVYDIDATTILLNDVLPPELDEKYGFVTDPDSYIKDHDNDGILERMVKFDRSEVEELLSPGEEVVLTITGQLDDGMVFEGTDTIRVILR